MSKKILITGGAGYIGTTLTSDLVNKGYEVTCVDSLIFGENFISELEIKKNYKFIKEDISNFKRMNEIITSENFYAVLHLASIVGDPACNLDKKLTEKINWDASKWLIDKSKELSIPRFIFASTCSNYGKMKDSSSFVDENSELAPVSLYAKLKVKVEKYILNQIDKTSVFSPTCLRFSTVYGLSPRMRFDLTVNEFVKEIALGRSLEVYGEQFWRPYCHVKDFSNAYLSVLNSPKKDIAYNVFNVGDTKENYTKKMIIEEIKKVLDVNSISYVKQIDDPRDYRVNSDKIKNKLGFKAKYKLLDGITEIANAIKNKSFLNTDDQIYYNIPHKIIKE